MTWSTSAHGGRLHPGSWWIWSIGLAVVASQTTNPVILVLVLVTVGVVAQRHRRRDDSTSLLPLLILAATVVGVRVVFRIIFGGAGTGGTVIFTLPQIPLPAAAAGISIGGPVTVTALLSALVDGLALATLLVCVAAASLLAEPRRLLKAAPAALYQLGTAVVIALTVVPQLLDAVVRVRRARVLRGTPPRGVRGLTSLLVPVLEDALEGSLDTAAAMDVRGYGRTATTSTHSHLVTSGLLLLGLLGICVGVYGALDATTPAAMGVPTMMVGTVIALLGGALAGQRDRRTRYLADPWGVPDWVVLVVSVVTAAVAITAGRVDAEVMHWRPSSSPPTLASGLVMATVFTLGVMGAVGLAAESHHGPSSAAEERR